MEANFKIPRDPHAISASQAIDELNSSEHGLSSNEVLQRQADFGRNSLPQQKTSSIFSIIARQFKSPLIYVLLIAAILSVTIQEWSDAIFIFAVLLINALIGTVQEYSAEKAALALRQMVATKCRVVRDGDYYELSAEELVPGDIVVLESGDMVPADLRLLKHYDLQIDESLLTGESLAVDKNSDDVLEEINVLSERTNMAFTGTLVNKGRATGIVVNTGVSTEIGRIASDVLSKASIKAPLVLRMESFTQKIAVVVLIAVTLFAGIALFQGVALNEIFLLAVALAVSAIPEGLPVALTVALSVGMHRMAKRNVIVRKLVAVESLGSCTYIATDKTGTLTVNQITASVIQFPNEPEWKISGLGFDPVGTMQTPNGAPTTAEEALLQRLYHSAILPNEGFLGRQNSHWVHHGDAVDVALLVMARKAGIAKNELQLPYEEISTIPFEPVNLYSASLNKVQDQSYIFVKGAVEKLLPMCSHMLTIEGEAVLDKDTIEKQALSLAEQGYRVLAFASGMAKTNEVILSPSVLDNLVFVGLVGMIDPLRSEAKAAIAACQEAGIKVAMVTGDNPVTAFSIAKELELCSDRGAVVTGPELKNQIDQQRLDSLISEATVFARVEPHQKLEIVESLQRRKHFVAVSGDGANDAPALKAAHVGVAMGESGTAIARETADIVLADDNFSSIVSGIEEGRVAYANVRKVIFLLISTGAAEIVLFTLSLLFGLPIPLLAVQLLWLNLVTNGIQDIALAFEPAEGNELKNPPRSPKESIFNRIMIERVIISALVMGVVAFSLFKWLLTQGFTVEEARNGTLLLMVFFENIQVFNSRSERLSVFNHNPLRNRLLLFGTVIAQLVHIIAMYTPWLSDVLMIQPVSLEQWTQLLAIALLLLVVMEGHKLFRKFQPY